MYTTNLTSHCKNFLSRIKFIGIATVLLASIISNQVLSANKSFINQDHHRENFQNQVVPVADHHAREPINLSEKQISKLGESFVQNVLEPSTIQPVSNNTVESNQTAEGLSEDFLGSSSINHHHIGQQAHPIGSGDDIDETGYDGTPDLAQLTAAGTAAGMMLANRFATDEPIHKPSQQSIDDKDEDNSDQSADLSTLQSYNPQNSVPSGGPADSSNEQVEPVNFEQMPDSIESLMGSEENDMVSENGRDDEQQDNGQQSASIPITANTDKGQALLVSSKETDSGEDDDDDDDDEISTLPSMNLLDGYLPSTDQTSGLVPNSNLIHNRQLKDAQMLSQPIDSVEDLNTAAGHYYKKKKKKVKKIIIKKKKKGKKYKKLKKIKIIKYKKKKKVMKKKKPMKKMHHHDHGKYYMYAKVPKKKSWEFGFKKGNKKHWIERHEKGHKSKFKTKVKWFDKKSKGKGYHVWDYNHHDKKKKKHH